MSEHKKTGDRTRLLLAPAGNPDKAETLRRKVADFLGIDAAEDVLILPTGTTFQVVQCDGAGIAEVEKRKKAEVEAAAEAAEADESEGGKPDSERTDLVQRGHAERHAPPPIDSDTYDHKTKVVPADLHPASVPSGQGATGQIDQTKLFSAGVSQPVEGRPTEGPDYPEGESAGGKGRRKKHKAADEKKPAE